MYWRRRVFALAGGLGLLGLLAWACSGAAGRTAAGGAVPSATAGPAGAQQAAQALRAAASATAGPANARTQRPGRARQRSGAQGQAALAGGGCAAGSLVLSLFGSGTTFGPGDRPRFQVDVVDVGSGGCVFDTGSRSVRLVIMSGTDRIWSSADCSRSTAPAPLRLRRGVPYIASFTWDEARSAPGCRAARTAALPGTYTATGYGGGAASPTAVFVLH